MKRRLLGFMAAAILVILIPVAVASQSKVAPTMSEPASEPVSANLHINGETIPIQNGQSVHRTTTTDNSTTNVDVTVTNSSTGNSTSNTTITVDSQ